MRRVNIIVGIKQRLNDILGHGTDGELETGLAAWSIQSAMLSNFRRLFKAMATGSVFGRILSGLEVSKAGGSSNTAVNITAGYGVTANGDIVYFEGASTFSIALGSDGTRYLYVNYSLAPMGDGTDGSKTTSVINDTAGPTQIVYDELGSSGQDNITGLVTEESSDNIGPDSVCIAVLVKTSGTLTVTPKTPLFTAL